MATSVENVKISAMNKPASAMMTMTVARSRRRMNSVIIGRWPLMDK